MRFVYFAERDGHIKIGYSRNPYQRVRALNARLISFVPGDKRLEAEYHRQFADAALGHEWFLATPRLRRLAESFPLPEPLVAKPIPPEVELLTAHDVADITGIGVAEVYQRVRRGALPTPVRVGPRLIRFRRAEVEALAPDTGPEAA